ncbi:MAG: dihydrofolate reductase [Candidatus Ryanbacteria bacterium]|nr:dihydrofolate reductase [Candidatus Ryanbacteria bacterium]
MDSNLNLSIVVAVSENGVIGVGGELPWNLKTDLKRFADLTKGHMVIVGRKTHEAILLRVGHHLKGRTTLVITRQKNYKGLASAVEIFHSWKDVLSSVKNRRDEVFVIGGSEVYNWALPFANTIYLTRVHTEFDGDAFFPPLDSDEWAEVSRQTHEADEKNSHPFSFITLKRRVVSRQFVNLEYARHEDQRAIMEGISQQGICPFCPENRVPGEILEPLRRGNYWTLVPNRWPYKFTSLHAMLIIERHIRFFDELKPEEVMELTELLGWARKTYGLTAYSLGLRCGDPHLTGGTVDHLHIHLVVASPEMDKPGYERVRFPMGPKLAPKTNNPGS